MGDAVPFLHPNRRGRTSTPLSRRAPPNDGSRETSRVLTNHRCAASATPRHRVATARSDSAESHYCGAVPRLVARARLGDRCHRDGRQSLTGWAASCRPVKGCGYVADTRAMSWTDATVTQTSNGHSGRIHTLQSSDRALYRWLLDIGLTPAKSLTLVPLAVPDTYFADFFRGCIDGDGSVRIYTDRYHLPKSERYVYERLYLSIVSASRAFAEWLHATVFRLTAMKGSLTVRCKLGGHPLWCLSYAKAKSIYLIAWMYYSPTIPALERKRARAERFLSPLGCGRTGSIGRPRVGWLYNVNPKLP